MKTLEIIVLGQGDDYASGCLLDLSKQQALNADPRAIQQINFTATLDRANNTRIFFILGKAKETVLDFSQGNLKVL